MPPQDALVRRRRATLAAVGLAAIAAFVLALLTLHIASVRDVPSHMSQFANSRFGLLWMTAVYTFLVGGAILVWALRPVLPDCPSKRAGLWMLVLAGVGALLLATFPTDRVKPVTLVGQIHNDAAMATFALLGCAMVALAPSFRASPTFRRFGHVSAALGVLVTLSWTTYAATTLAGSELKGPIQRILVVLIVLWFVLVALHLRREQPTADPVYVAERRRKGTAALRAAS